MVTDNSRTAIGRFVKRVDTPEGGAPVTIYYLRAGCTRAQRLEVLAELRKRFPNATNISAIGDEIAVFFDVAT
jgi:hypothetical protein